MSTGTMSTGTMSNLRGPRAARRRRPRELKETAPPESSSLMWTILLIGLAFCLADVAYILHYVDQQQQQGNSPSNQGVYNPLDAESGLTLEEYKLMDYQLHKHEVQIFNQEHPLHSVPDSAPDLTPNDPLTEQEWATILEEKKPILDMLKQAKVPIRDLEPRTLRALPTWKEITDLYGNEPRIYGLEQCPDFQTHSDPAEHFVSTAGTFNSGTNLMAELLISNCHMQPRMDKYGVTNRGVRWQVPWGKHTPPGDEEFRLSHKTLKDADVDATNILPAVTIRDPYVWMNSMCRIEYSAHWHHDPNRHCPNLIPDSADLQEFGRFVKEGKPVKVHVKYNGFWKHHDSLVGMWNDWYGEYYKGVDFNRLMVRYEDLLFFPRQVTEAVCKCAGGSLRRDGSFEFVLDSAKKGLTAHGPMEYRTGFIKAIIKYGKATHRTARYAKDDLEYAKEYLDKDMMEFFRYKHPDELSNPS